MTDWALVTGASGRGGAAIAKALHARGLGLVVHHSPRSAEPAGNLVAEFNRIRRGSAIGWSCDLQPGVLPPVGVHPAPSVVVCNASVYEASELGDDAKALRDFDLHVRAHASLLNALRASLKSVVTVTDIHTDRPAPGQVWYTVAKAGLQALTLALAVEWAPQVRCNVVAPGTMPYPPDWDQPDRAALINTTIPLGRLGTFEELASAVVFLALDATYTTGQILTVDGGRSRYLP
jgi:pteridine reductase